MSKLSIRNLSLKRGAAPSAADDMHTLLWRAR